MTMKVNELLVAMGLGFSVLTMLEVRMIVPALVCYVVAVVWTLRYDH